MNDEEIRALMDELKSKGYSEEDIADGILWPLFRDGKMSKEDLATLCESIGLELADDFANDEHETPEEAEDGEGEVTKEEAEDLKQLKPGETAKEFKERAEEAQEGEPEAGEDEEEEWEDVRKNIFKL